MEYATKFAWSNRIPFLTRVLPAGEGNDGTNQVKNILRINSENVLLVNMTPVENEKAVMLQLREIGGKW